MYFSPSLCGIVMPFRAIIGEARTCNPRAGKSNMLDSRLVGVSMFQNLASTVIESKTVLMRFQYDHLVTTNISNHLLIANMDL